MMRVNEERSEGSVKKFRMKCKQTKLRPKSSLLKQSSNMIPQLSNLARTKHPHPQSESIVPLTPIANSASPPTRPKN